MRKKPVRRELRSAAGALQPGATRPAEMAAKQLVVGLTGRNGAGKGAVAEVLKDKGFLYYSLSDAIRAHLKANGIPESRENLVRTTQGKDVAGSTSWSRDTIWSELCRLPRPC